MADRVIPKDGGYALPLRDSVCNTEQIEFDDIVHVSEWLLRLTPAAGFAVQQTMVEYPQVVAHYAPSAGYFPLPGWAGLALLCAYTVIMVRIAVGRKPAADTDWR